MLGSQFLLAIKAAVPKSPAEVVDRLHVTGREPLPRLHVGGIVRQPPTRLELVQVGPNQRLHVTGFEPFPRLHVGGLPEPVRKGTANASGGGLDGLLYGLRAVKKKSAPKAILPPSPVSEIVVTFPTQYSGFRIRKTSSTIDLCMVATSDAPSGMGGQLRIRRPAGTFAVYLVETSDPNASPVRIRTSAGTKAIRLKT